MVSQKYRWDFIGLSTDEKPTSETSDKVVNGSTYYCSDTSKLYVYCDGTWYERKPLGGGGSGGTSDFNDLSNRPKYNGSEMNGSTDIPEVVTYSDFTGTDGTAAGAAGLVPAPATTDTGKFLSASGLWEEAAGGGGITELTSADYNYPASSPNSIAVWLLDDGVYRITAPYGASDSTRVYYNSSDTEYVSSQILVMVQRERDSSSNRTHIWIIGADGTVSTAYVYKGLRYYKVATSTGVKVSSSYALMEGNVDQSTGTNTTNVMSQNATTSMVFADPSTKSQVRIGNGASSTLQGNIAIGKNSNSSGSGGVSLGQNSKAQGPASVALGSGAVTTSGVRGEVNIGSNATGYTTSGYNNSQYRLLTGLYDGQSAHDAATVAQGNTLSTSAPTTSTVGVLGQLYTDTTNMRTYQCTAISGDTYTWTQRW